MNGKKIGGWMVRDGFAAVEIGSAGVGGECGGHPRNGITRVCHLSSPEK